MIYSNLNETEIEKITAILKQCKVEYKVSENEEILKALSEGDTYKQAQKIGRRGLPTMQIEIDIEEFKKIPGNLKDRLHSLGVFEDAENPFSEEELNSIPEKPVAPQETVEDPRNQMKQFVTILAVIAVGFLYLYAKEKGWL